MVVGWIYPGALKCGIAAYSGRYIDALRATGLEVREYKWNARVEECKKIDSVNECDIIHIQYEQSVFMDGRKDLYPLICKRIRKPVIVSLHEVYEFFPGVYPRVLIKGPLKTLKRAVYDYRHPAQRAFDNSVKKNFFATKVILHHQFHRDILLKKGMDNRVVTVLGHPVSSTRHSGKALSFDESGPVEIGAAGFINPQYNYELLFKVLEKLSVDWRFTWVGGTRNGEHESILERVLKNVKSLGWEDRFTVTGWLEKDRFEEALGKIDIALSLFLNRSSSESIADMLASGIMVVGTDIPVIREIEAHYHPLLVVKPDADQIAEVVQRLCTEKSLRKKVVEGMALYHENYSHENLSEKLKSIYCEINRA